jgi:ABC transport system ATP-binding/permease protein
LSIPNWLHQIGVYVRRDIKSKISNTQYVALNMLEAPVLGLILSYIIRYIADPNSNIYIFRENSNIPIYIFMALIVALFLGLMVSAEEIFKDRKILKRESFLNLSRSSYLLSKVVILILISAIQSFTFVIIANTILGIQGMYLEYWLALFSTALFANMLGLNISSSFNSAVTIYIILPLLMIPMMVLSGAMFNFEKLNRTVGSVDKVPFIADMMATKWSYEALMVHQFKDNEFEKNFYDVDKEISNSDYMVADYLPEITKRLDKCMAELSVKNKIDTTFHDLFLIQNELKYQLFLLPELSFDKLNQLVPSKFSFEIGNSVYDFINELNKYYSQRYTIANTKREGMISYLVKNQGRVYYAKKDAYDNESVSDQVRKVFEKNRILEYGGHLIRQKDPVFVDPPIRGYWGFRAHFYAPRKYFMGQYWDTYWFNIAIIWSMIVVLYIVLYFDILRRLLTLPETLRLRYSKGKS